MMSLAATIEPLRAANRAASKTLFAWRLLSPDGTAPVSSSGLRIQVDCALGLETVGDVLIVIAAFNARRYGVPVLAALRRAARVAHAIGGVESGSWVLAQAGLLDGYRATTHWEELEEFEMAFPKVDVVADRYVLDRRRFTAGGAAPTLDMMLRLIHGQHGLALALDVASIFIYDQRQEADDPQSIVMLGGLSQRDPQVADAIRAMECHLEEPLPLVTIARNLKLSTRSMQMRFKGSLGVSPHAYYLALRLAAARRRLQQTQHSAGEIAAIFGFKSGSTFARAFRARYGVSPTQARRQPPSGWVWSDPRQG